MYQLDFVFLVTTNFIRSKFPPARPKIFAFFAKSDKIMRDVESEFYHTDNSERPVTKVLINFVIICYIF